MCEWAWVSVTQCVRESPWLSIKLSSQYSVIGKLASTTYKQNKVVIFLKLLIMWTRVWVHIIKEGKPMKERKNEWKKEREDTTVTNRDGRRQVKYGTPFCLRLLSKQAPFFRSRHATAREITYSITIAGKQAIIRLNDFSRTGVWCFPLKMMTNFYS